MTKTRRRLANLLAKAAVRISPDPPTSITVKQVVEIDPTLIVDAISGAVGGRIGMSRGDDGGVRY